MFEKDMLFWGETEGEEGKGGFRGEGEREIGDFVYGGGFGDVGGRGMVVEGEEGGEVGVGGEEG